MEISRQRAIAYTAIAVLAIVLVSVLIYLQLSKGRERVTVPVRRPVTIEGLDAAVVARSFDTAVLNDPRYHALDQSLVEQGRLPVPPPAARGKPNLF